MMTRRELLAGMLASTVGTKAWAKVASGRGRAKARPKLAAVVTTYFKYSHAQHIVDRFLIGYGWESKFHRPPFDLAGLYVDQVGKNDLSRGRAREFPSMKIYPTIAEALTLGGSKLAVDGVLLIGEHGHYPKNKLHQTLYPRYQFFEQIVKVFQSSGRSVPVYNDKHLSWNWQWARKMYDTSRRMGFPLMAGSSVPVTWRTPSFEMPSEGRVREAVCVAWGGVDSYDFHALETLQCMVERRKGGEVGVKWLQAYQGEDFWKAYEEGVWAKDLMKAALCRSHTLTPARPTFNDVYPTDDDMRRLVKDPVAYHYEHLDGIRCTMMLMNGLVQDFNFAARIHGRPGIFSTQMYIPMPPSATLADCFNPHVHHMEQMFLTGRTAYPVERTLLTTGLTAAGMESLYRKQRYETPHLKISYQSTKESTFWRT